MALDEERLESSEAVEPSLIDRVKSVASKPRKFAQDVAKASGHLAARSSAQAGEFSSKITDATVKAYRLPRWTKPFVYGFIRMHRAWAPARRLLSDVFVHPIARFLSANLLRRILASNLLGFAILVGGFLFLNQNSTVLLEEKRRALEVQAEMIAAAIASGAKVRSDDIYIDADKLPLDRDTRFPTRGDAFTRHEMSLSPEQLAPILNKMVSATKARARILNYEGRLIIDTASLLSRGQIIETDQVDSGKRKKKPKNFWTRVIEFMIGREYEVYQERANVMPTDYPEVNRALSSGKNQAMILLTPSSEQVVTAIVPIQRLNSLQGLVMLSSREGEMTEILRKNRDRIWPLALVALLATLVTSYFLSRTVAGPMKRLSRTAENVSRNINTYQDSPELTSRTDEVGQMAQAFKAMTHSLFRRIENSERFAADVAHELKNPLTAASSTAESLEYAKTPEQRAVLVQQIRGELRRLNRLITDVSSASRLDAELARQAQDPVEIDKLLQDMMMLFTPKCETFGCDVKLHITPPSGKSSEPQIGNPFTVHGNAGRLAQVLTNLIDNAISFSTEGQIVNVTAERIGDTIRILVEDEGPGIDEDKLETIFDRFYTYRPTEESSRGDNSGLGLNISREIINAHGGLVWAENRYAKETPNKPKNDADRQGARFVVELGAAHLENKTPKSRGDK